MATTVTRKFRDDFDCWAADRLARGEFTQDDMAEFKDLLRKDLTPGPDQLREGLMVIIAAGIEVPVSIDDHEERYRLWSEYFSVEAEAIRRPGPQLDGLMPTYTQRKSNQ